MRDVFAVGGMTCTVCSNHVDRAVRTLAGVREVQVDLLQNRMTVDYDDTRVSRAAIIAAVEHAGYTAALAAETAPSGDRTLRRRLTVSFVCLALLMILSMGPMWGLTLPGMLAQPLCRSLLELLLILPVLAVNRDYYRRGLPALWHRSPTMDSLVAVGSGAAFLNGLVSCVLIAVCAGRDPARAAALSEHLYFESAGMILTLVTVGKALESRSKARTAEAVTRLMRLTPATAVVLRDGTEVTVHASEVAVGDTVVIRAGQALPVDGVVLSGTGSLDEAALTGESLPVDKAPGDSVTGATLCRSGYFTFRATRVGEDTALSGIIRLVEEAARSKAPLSRLADRVAAVFVPTVMGLSAVTLAVWLLCGAAFSTALSFAIAVLVVSCPCALGLATPTAIMVGTGKGAEYGVLIRSAAALEQIGKADVVALDKTGTVTAGEPVLTDLCPLTGSDTALLTAAASLEYASDHPLSRAIVREAQRRQLALSAVTEFEEHPGGVTGVVDGHTVAVGNETLMTALGVPMAAFGDTAPLTDAGKTPLLMAVDGRAAGLLAVSDPPKDGAAEAVRELRRLGLTPVMLTGDNARTARAVAGAVGIERCVAGILPGEKAAEIRALQKAGHRVVMVGDGINDAPALTAADVGIAIGAGTDVALDCADVVLVRSAPADAVTAFRLSRATVRNIKENLFWAFFYNLCGIPLAAGVFYPLWHIALSPLFGAAAMCLSSLFVVSNALRLRRFRPLTAPGKEEIGMTKVLTVEGMMCPKCQAHVERALAALPGVTATVSLESGTATVTAAGPVEDAALIAAVTEAGYTVTDVR